MISDRIDQRPLSLTRTRQIGFVGFFDALIERKLRSDAFVIWREVCFSFAEIQRYLLPLIHYRFFFFFFRENRVPVIPICFRNGFLALAPL